MDMDIERERMIQECKPLMEAIVYLKDGTVGGAFGCSLDK